MNISRFRSTAKSPSPWPVLTELLRWTRFSVTSRAAAATVIALAIGIGATKAQNASFDSNFSVLVFSKTVGFRHDSIPDGIRAIQALGVENGFRVDATEDASVFSSDQLKPYRVVVFLNTTQDVLNEDQQSAFESYIKSGGGFVGVHSAADTEYGWPFYGRLVGAYFQSHPKIQTAVTRVVDPAQPSTKDLPAEWKRTDEWYNYRQPPSPDVQVLVKLDESSYSGGSMQGNHPIAWRHVFSGGRAWYTGMGHTKESYTEPLYLKHLLGGILWAAGVAK